MFNSETATQLPLPIGPYSFDEFKELARSFHGYPAPGLLIGGYMVEKARARLPEGTLFEVIVETAKCLPDAVQLLTLCTYGNGRIRLAKTGRFALALYDKHTGKGWRVCIDPMKLGRWPEIETWLLKKKSKQEQDADRLLEEIGLAGEELFRIERISISASFLGKKPSGPIAPCPGCGEPYTAADGPICRGCLGETPYGHAQKHAAEDCPDGLEAVPVHEAVGRTVLHDMTRIVPGLSKGPGFKTGQSITAGDICQLQQTGRSRVYVRETLQPEDCWVHEDEAVLALAERMVGDGLTFKAPPSEGKINLKAARDGLFVLDRERLRAFNMLPNLMCATRQGETVVEKGRSVAGTRAIPLYIRRENLAAALGVLGQNPLFSILELKALPVGILVTGTEIYQGLVQDRFVPIITGKVDTFDCPVVATDIQPDDREAIATTVRRMLDSGAKLIVTTAGLSVDPDDVTRQGLLDAGLTDMLYGAPVLPGAMTLLGRIGSARVLGVPACALFYKTTSLDLFLPRLLAGVDITRKDLARMAEGGLCLGCKACTFPKCPFGK
ncbi:MAG: trehalose-binding protein [Desulfohalobiaceae bacterium]|nr:trehalose-binding protein [Desulfohalobiaceae bacterium]